MIEKIWEIKRLWWPRRWQYYCISNSINNNYILFWVHNIRENFKTHHFFLPLKMTLAYTLRKGLKLLNYNKDMNLTRTWNAFWEANDKKIDASLDNAEPPPAKSDNALIAMKGILCWKQTKATEALSMSVGVASNLQFRWSL